MPEQYAFGPNGKFVIDCDQSVLYDKVTPKNISRRLFLLLAYFVRNPKRDLSREELALGAWNDEAQAARVQSSIVQLRKILGEKKNQPRLIVVIPRVGYKLDSDVSTVSGLATLALPAKVFRPLQADLPEVGISHFTAGEVHVCKPGSEVTVMLDERVLYQIVIEGASTEVVTVNVPPRHLVSTVQQGGQKTTYLHAPDRTDEESAQVQGELILLSPETWVKVYTDGRPLCNIVASSHEAQSGVEILIPPGKEISVVSTKNVITYQHSTTC